MFITSRKAIGWPTRVEPVAVPGERLGVEPVVVVEAGLLGPLGVSGHRPLDVEPPAGCRRSGGEMANMLIGVYDSLYAAGAEFGLADPMRASEFRKDMAEAGADGRYYCLTPVLIAAWKRMT